MPKKRYTPEQINQWFKSNHFRTAVVLQTPWKQCSVWTGWTIQECFTREDGQGNTPNTPMESLPDNFESVGSRLPQILNQQSPVLLHKMNNK